MARNRKPDGRYQPWFAHNQAYLRRRRPKPRRFAVDDELREAVAGKLAKHWSPAQISRWLRRRYPRRRGWQVCTETIYEAVYRGLIVPVDRQNLRTGRTYRHRRGRGRTRDGALKQSTSMKSIHQRPAAVASRRQAGHWEGDLIIGAGQRSAIATLVERKFRTTILVRVPRDHSAQSVGDALIGAFSQLPTRLRRTLTWDQGNEMFHHQRIEQHDRTEDLLRRPALAVAARQQREHQRPAAAVLPEGHRPQRLDRRPARRRRRRAQRPSPTLPRRPDTERKPCNDGHVSTHDDDSQRSLETARSIR